MTDTCATCFFFQGQNECRFAAPVLIVDSGLHWPQVLATDWCGQGADVTDGRSFSSAVNSLPSSAPGTPTTLWYGADNPPASGFGADGDFYWHPSVVEPGGENFVYVKVGGAWSLLAKWISA